MKATHSFYLTLIVLVSSMAISTPVSGQDQEDSKIIRSYVGIQPAITVEPYDEYRNTADINIFPFIFEMAMSKHISFKISPIVNLQLRPEYPSAISHLGAGLTVPYYFSKKNSEEGQRGFYAGPHLAATYHQLDRFTSTTLAGEIGYAFLFNNVLSVTVGAQAGTSIFINPETGYNLLVPHTGAIFSFGFWF